VGAGKIGSNFSSYLLAGLQLKMGAAIIVKSPSSEEFSAVFLYPHSSYFWALE
jgi:hypothetical protein